MFRKGLKLGDLLVQTGDILFDDVGEFLRARGGLGGDLREERIGGRLTLISTGRSSNNVFRFATAHHAIPSAIVSSRVPPIDSTTSSSLPPPLKATKLTLSQLLQLLRRPLNILPNLGGHPSEFSADSLISSSVRSRR